MENYVGKRLDGRYEIREIIGVGGMAVVYKAYDNIDDRIVAVKILKSEFLANEEFRRRFKNESKAIAVLSHTNIVKVYDVSYGDRLQYIVMEYVEGITLKEYIQQQGVINHREAVFFMMQILRALQHAHDKGIVHRDIKPQNILLLENGAIKVTDFGIARFSASETRTMTDSTIGSVHYISPEQARGDLTDEKADIYSVGVMLYEMMTGRLPFESDNTVSVAIMQLQQDPVMPRDINPSIPIGLEQIIIRAMQKNVYDRYQSAAEMLLDLEEFKRNTSIRFDYDYTNNGPTKYIPNITGHIQKVETYSEDEDDEPMVKNRTIPILIGIVVALVVILAGVFGVMYFTGAFDNNVKVPKFEGLIYSEEVFAQEYGEFRIEIDEKVDTDAKPNQILSQTPEAGEKINPEKDVIKIEIAVRSESVIVPDYNGEVYGAEVEDAFRKLGLKIIPQVLSGDDYPESAVNKVYKTIPSPGTRVSVGSTVTIQYVQNQNTAVRVPSVVGLTESAARNVLTESGFTVDAVYEYNDNVMKDYVISNTSIDQKLSKGSKVVIYVSLGELVEQTTKLHITLPQTGDYGTISATLDGTSVISDYCKFDGSEYELSVVGHEATSVLKVFADGKLIYKCNINFTTLPCDISNAAVYTFEPDTTTQSTTENTTVEMPMVVGMTVEEAKAVLAEKGFKNVTVHEVGSKVASQYPFTGFYPTDVIITLYCGE